MIGLRLFDFTIEILPGVVTIEETLTDADPVYTLSIEVTDGCLSSQAELTIRVKKEVLGGSTC